MGQIKNSKTESNADKTNELSNAIPSEFKGFDISSYPTAKQMKEHTNTSNNAVMRQVFAAIESSASSGKYDTKISVRTSMPSKTMTTILMNLGYKISGLSQNGTYIEFNISWYNN